MAEPAKEPKQVPVYRIRFTEEAVENRVTEGVLGKQDENYTITYRVGTELDVTAASYAHWMARGKVVLVGDATGEPPSIGGRPVSVAPQHQHQNRVGGMQLPPPPA